MGMSTYRFGAKDFSQTVLAVKTSADMSQEAVAKLAEMLGHRMQALVEGLELPISMTGGDPSVYAQVLAHTKYAELYSRPCFSNYDKAVGAMRIGFGVRATSEMFDRQNFGELVANLHSDLQLRLNVQSCLRACEQLDQMPWPEFQNIPEMDDQLRQLRNYAMDAQDEGDPAMYARFRQNVGVLPCDLLEPRLAFFLKEAIRFEKEVGAPVNAVIEQYQTEAKQLLSVVYEAAKAQGFGLFFESQHEALSNQIGFKLVQKSDLLPLLGAKPSSKPIPTVPLALETDLQTIEPNMCVLEARKLVQQIVAQYNSYYAGSDLEQLWTLSSLNALDRDAIVELREVVDADMQERKVDEELFGQFENTSWRKPYDASQEMEGLVQ